MSKIEKSKQSKLNTTPIENLNVFTNPSYYDSVVKHLNQIADIPEKKKYEWEDEENLPEESYGIDFEMKDWSDMFEVKFERVEIPDKIISTYNVEYDTESYQHLIPEFVSIINGIIREPTFIFRNKSNYMYDFSNKNTGNPSFVTIEDALQFYKNLRKNHSQATIFISPFRCMNRNNNLIDSNVTEKTNNNFANRYHIIED